MLMSTSAVEAWAQTPELLLVSEMEGKPCTPHATHTPHTTQTPVRFFGKCSRFCARTRANGSEEGGPRVVPADCSELLTHL